MLSCVVPWVTLASCQSGNGHFSRELGQVAVTEEPTLIGQQGVILPPHYVWGDGSDAWHLVGLPTLSVIRERIPVGASEVRRQHLRARQAFVVLAGLGRIEIEDEPFLAGTNQSALILPLVNHSVVNASEEDLHLLVISLPHSHGDQIDTAEDAS